MKKQVVFYILIIVACTVCLYAGLVDVYKKGTIKIKSDPTFGKKTDFESLIYENQKDILVTIDGFVFVSNQNTHNFFEFDALGNLMGTFSREGRGPGDQYSPHLNSTLDGRYLVFNDYSPHHKISLFEFSGRFFSTLRTKNECSNAVGLKNGIIAYSSGKIKLIQKSGKLISTIYIHLINMNSSEERKFVLGEAANGIVLVSPSYSIGGDNYLGDVILRKTRDGNLLAGISNSPDLKMVSETGKLIKTIPLKMSPIPVTDTHIMNAKQALITEMQAEYKDKEVAKKMRSAIEKADYSEFFGKYLPYYKSFIVDAEGNILVFKWQEKPGKANEIFQVYSPAGEFICETVLDEGAFDVQIDFRFQTIQFAPNALYGIFNCDDENGDPMTRFIKVKY
jgi:hypothetical protein